MSRIVAAGWTEAVLENGLRVYVAPQPHLHRAHVALHVRVGSRYESLETNGISHFLEHMIYRGTERVPTAHDVNLAFEERGGDLHASTQTDYGVFSLSLPKGSLDEATGLFAEVLARPAFRGIDIEQGIVCEEILEDKDDEGREIDPDNLSRALIYQGHPLGFTITGDEASVRRFDQGALRRHHARHYVARGCVLTFSGAVDPEHALSLARRDFSAFPGGDPVVPDPAPHDQTAPRLSIVESQSSQTDLRVCFRALGERAPERPALELLMRIIDDGMSTRLYHRVCDDQGLCYDVSAGYDGYEDDGVVDFAAGVQHRRVERVTREILAVVSELARGGPTEAELEKAKRRHRWDVETMLDSAEELGSFIGTGALFDQLETPDERATSLARVSPKEVQQVARILADPARLTVVAVGMLEPREQRRLEETVMGFTSK